MKTEWSPLAKTQLFEILRFYTKRNQTPHYSKRLKRDFLRIVGYIRNNPYFGEQLPFDEHRRKVSIGNFVLIYEIHDKMIEICSIRDGRRDEP